jgi:hypothetical protein
MAGTIPISMTQQFNEYAQPLAGGQLYIIQAGTVSTPQDAFQDLALTIKQPYPMSLDAAGRVPQFFLADGTVKIRLQDAHGVVQLAADQVLVIGPSSGSGGGGGAIDPTTIYQTGDMKPRYGVGAHTGWVRGNGLTIGSATSGATERANLDCQALFQHLWGADSSLAVSGGRGGSGSADWTANKQLTLPDWRGYVMSALDDMGNTAANRLGAFFANATTLGSAGGAPGMTITTSNLPPYTPAATLLDTRTWGVTSANGAGLGTQSAPGSPPTFQALAVSAGIPVVPVVTVTGGSISWTPTPQGGVSTPFGLISPRKLVTFYLKL